MKNPLLYGALAVSDCAKELKRVFGTVLCILFFLSDASAQFQHRAYYGWIIDLASEGRPNDPWPSTRIDDKLLNEALQLYPDREPHSKSERSKM